MTSHFGLLIVFSGFVALTFAVLMRDQPVSQLRFGFTLLAWLDPVLMSHCINKRTISTLHSTTPTGRTDADHSRLCI